MFTRSWPPLPPFSFSILLSLKSPQCYLGHIPPPRAGSRFPKALLWASGFESLASPGEALRLPCPPSSSTISCPWLSCPFPTGVPGSALQTEPRSPASPRGPRPPTWPGPHERPPQPCLPGCLLGGFSSHRGVTAWQTHSSGYPRRPGALGWAGVQRGGIPFSGYVANKQGSGVWVRSGCGVTSLCCLPRTA